MTEDQRLEEEIRRAGRAKEILENQLFKEAVDEIEESIKQGRLNSAATAVDLREKLADQERALYAIISKLKTHMETGELAKEEIRRRSLAEKVQDFLQQP